MNEAATDPERAGSGAWTEPGLELVAPGVHRLALPLPSDGLRAVNVYLIEDAGRLVLIDSGWNVPEAVTLLDGALAELGAGVGDIERFLVTHVHRDHYTMAIDVRRRVGTPVHLGREEKPSLDGVQGFRLRAFEPQMESLRRAGIPELVDRVQAAVTQPTAEDLAIWEYPDGWLGPGPVTLPSGRVLQAVETPGHTRGHLVFSDVAAGLLFAGDHVLPTITPSIGFEVARTENPLGDFLGSLARVRAMPDARLLPAHGPVTDSVHRRVDELVDHHGRRLAEMSAALESGATTGAEVAAQVRWTRRGTAFGDLDPFNQMVAIGETLAHLVLLVAQERVQRIDGDGGVWRFFPLS